VIVRISGEGQYDVGDADVAALNELDNATVTACQAGDGSGFADVYAELVEFVRSKGKKLDDDELLGSDIILPPPDLSVEEARVAFQGDGLIPG
jgi:hypothetical protein